MNKLIFKNFCFLAIINLLVIKNIFALVPVENLILGNFKGEYSENRSDPLNYIFSRDQEFKNSRKSFKKELALYRGFYEEGKNLENYCAKTREINYSSEWEKIQVERSIFSLIQYIGLDLTIRAIPKYAKDLDFTREEFVNLTDSLIGNYCTKNLSVISLKELKNNMMLKFDSENSYRLPSVEENPLFPTNLHEYLPPKKALEQEFKYTIKLFQSICSWGGNPNVPGLMTSLVKNPALFSFFIRQMDNKVIDWHEADNTIFLKEDKNTVQVWCDNLICRKTFRDNFYNKFYYSIGGTSVSEDYKRLYCEKYRTLEPNTRELDKRLKKLIDTQSTDDTNFIAGQFIALITSIPDFLLRGETYEKSGLALRSNIDYAFDTWAKKESEKAIKDIYYEEPLQLELIERDLFFNPNEKKLALMFDVNLGEFDRINQKVGKLKLNFTIKISNAFLAYYQDAYSNTDPRDKVAKEILINKLKLQITADVQNARKKLLIPPWRGDLEEIIAYELTEQMQLLSDAEKYFDRTGVHKVNVDISYGIFALKYLNHQFKVNKTNTENKVK